jgi:hypothetical protein
MFKNLTLLIAFLMMIGSQVVAYDPADLQRLKDTGFCQECDLFHADLKGANLKGADLKGALLQYATMEGVILCNTIMPDGSVIYSGC